MGAALGAPPVNFKGMFAHVDGGPLQFLMLYALSGFDAAYPELQLGSYLTKRGRRIIGRLRDTCLQEAVALGLLIPKSASAYFTSSPLDSASWTRRLRQNHLGARAPRTPVLLGSARQDEAIPFSQVEKLYGAWCSRGVNPHFVRIPAGEHITGRVAFAPTAFTFLADRFAGKPLARAGDCNI